MNENVEDLQARVEELEQEVADLQHDLDMANDEISVLQDDLDGASEREEDARQAGYDEALESAVRAIKNLQ